MSETTSNGREMDADLEQLKVLYDNAETDEVEEGWSELTFAHEDLRFYEAIYNAFPALVQRLEAAEAERDALRQQLRRFADEIRQQGLRAGERKTEAEAWNDAPHYRTDLNTAIALIQDHYLVSGRQKFGDTLFFAAITDESGTYEGYGRTRAESICRAWLAWKEAQP